ncbi:MAG: cytochrome c oxidase assembly factor Coa1 family protein [Thermoleophilia bacterium]
MRRGPQRAVLILAGVMLGAFAIVAFVFRRLDVSQGTLSIVGGALAYAFIAAVAVILLVTWRRRGRSAGEVARRYVARHPAVISSVGTPVHVGEPQGETAMGRAAGQVNLTVPVDGPEDVARVDLVMARLSSSWEVLSATLMVDGDRVPLAGGAAETRTDED